MKLYLTVTAFVVGTFATFGIILPFLVSAPSDYAIGLALVVAVAYPVVAYQTILNIMKQVTK